MDKLLDNIYKKFFLRDVLSIFMCGFLFLLAVLRIYGDPIKNILSNHIDIVRKILINKDDELSLFSYVLLIGVSYALGLIINWFRDYVQFRCSKKLSDKCNYGENVKKYREKVEKFYKSYKDQSEIKDDFERMIVMFQVTGNLALTIILCIISMGDLLLSKLIIGCVGFVIALICFSIFKFKEHIDYLEEKSKEKYWFYD